MLHSVIQNCCWITLQVSHHQKWRVKLIFRGAWKSLMAWRDWTWRPVFNDRSTPLSLYERCVSSKNNSGHGPGKITGKKIRKYWCSCVRSSSESFVVPRYLYVACKPQSNPRILCIFIALRRVETHPADVNLWTVIMQPWPGEHFSSFTERIAIITRK